ncbi:CHRD domain-containing protein [Roseibacillus ishigakijimensis]|uniref:CHRD domain-containing protein n=1 Tax=Roseibacillus ishigakijimensis TaxID=454146 RepID=A0A934RV28_9BACT|nr:CHRD domain-containing protein [Roseibacillus ishigakijimensis]MBK1834705.1 CHRD domain-containing protein [Roseibacillus ishigakijimensis]
MKTSLILSLLSLFPLTAQGALYNLSGLMDPVQATTNPANTGNGSGTIGGTYDSDTKLLSYSITFQDLTSAVTNMHFHLGAPGTAGGVEVAVPGPWSSPQNGTATLSQAHEDNLLGGLWYVNVHTEDFGAGEIRGQVAATLVPEPSTALLAGLALCGMAFRRR